MTFYRNTVWFVKAMREYTRSGYESAAARFNSEELADVRLDGQHVLVTGANSGIGLACCKEFAKRGAVIHMVCRSKERGDAAREAVLKSTDNPNVTVHLHQLDMAQPRKVFELANQLNDQLEKLDVLVNNAGCMVHELTVDADNLEVNFAANTLGPYILTESLVPTLKKSSDPRVITVSSGGMLVEKLNHIDPMLIEQRSNFDATMMYAQNKRQQVIMTEMWAEAHPDIHFFSMHPGWADTPAVASSLPNFYRLMRSRMRTPEQGADTAIWLALTPKVKSFVNGSFFQDRQIVAKHLPLARTHSSREEKLEFMSRMAEIARPFMS